MFISALLTIAKIWNQPKCLWTEEWIKELQYIYTMEYYSAIKRKETMALEETWMALEKAKRQTKKPKTWMDLEIIILSEVSQTMRHQHQTNIKCYQLHVESKKRTQ